MNRRAFDLVVFDWDGTLFDSTALIVKSIQGACRDIGAEVPSDAAASYVIGLGLSDALKHAAPNVEEAMYPELAKRYRYHYVTRQHELSLFKGSLALLQSLKGRQQKLAVATGKARRGLDDALKHADLVGMFDATRTADETVSKPDPTMLLQLMVQMGVPPERTLMVGDTTHDLEMARRAGTPCAAVSFGAHESDTLAAYDPLVVAHSTAELQAWFDRHG
jgi:phosphoglycolate phosphatase